MKHTYILFVYLLISAAAFGQANDPQSGRAPLSEGEGLGVRPYVGYWQQSVHYTIKAELNDATDLINGSEQLTYSNNSPDTLLFVYFHLYQNAFQPGSYLDALEKANGVQPKYSQH